MSPILSPRLHEKSCGRDVPHMCKKFTILYCQYLTNIDCLYLQNSFFKIVVNTLAVVSQVTTKLCDDHLPYTIGQHAIKILAMPLETSSWAC